MAIDPVRIDLQAVSKRYGRQWVLRNQNVNLISGNRYGVSGRNGSGKSTLLRILSGQLTPTRGQITYYRNERKVAVAEWYRLVSWTGPYLEVTEELTVEENLRFYFSLKPLRDDVDVDLVLDRIGMRGVRDRRLSECSSGMRQRVVLATAIYAATPLILLDEPSLTLDGASAEWLYGELDVYTRDRLFVLASNDDRDLASCESIIPL